MKPVPFPSTASSFRRYAAQAQPFMLLLWVAMGAFPAWAQTGASLSGVVTDQTGAALRDVAVTFRNVDTGATRTIATDGAGHYQCVRPASRALRDSSGKTRVRQ